MTVVSGRIVVRGSLAWFVEWQEAKLRKKDPEHPDGWDNTPIADLMEHLQDELSELMVALVDPRPERVIDECVDVANIAMMIADITERKRPR